MPLKDDFKSKFLDLINVFSISSVNEQVHGR